MWRPNPRFSQWIIWRKVTTDWNNLDEKGNPAQKKEDFPVYAEVYSGTDPIIRQAFGLGREETLTIQMAGKLPGMEDLLVIDRRIFRPASISECDPVQITAVFTGQKEENSDG